jgi:hypothetical protein
MLLAPATYLTWLAAAIVAAVSQLHNSRGYRKQHIIQQQYNVLARE